MPREEENVVTREDAIDQLAEKDLAKTKLEDLK